MIKDGTPSIPIAANASIASNDVMLQGMIVTLTNVIHAGEEFLSVTGIEPSITLVRHLLHCLPSQSVITTCRQAGVMKI